MLRRTRPTAWSTASPKTSAATARSSAKPSLVFQQAVCERPSSLRGAKRRSNPDFVQLKTLDCFASFAMTKIKLILATRCAPEAWHTTRQISAEHHRVTPEPAMGPAFGSIMLCDKSVARLSNAKPGMDISSFTIVPGFHRVGHFGPDPLVQPGLGTTFARRTGGAKRYPSSSASAEDERWVLQGLNPPYLRQSPQAPVVFDRRKIIFSSQAFSRFRRSPPPVKYGVDTTRADVLT